MRNEKSLFQLRRFWVAVIIPVMISVAVAAYIVLTSNLSYVPGHKGLNDAITIFKVPLTILALIFPIIAIIASSHRSEQTKKQIIASNSQNQFSNYYKHLEEFEKITLRMQSRFNLKSINHIELYLIIFPRNSPHYVELTSTGVHGSRESKLKIVVDTLNDKINKINGSESSGEGLIDELDSFFSMLIGFSNELRFFPDKTQQVRSVVFYPFANISPLIVDEKNPFIHYHAFADYVSYISNFCQERFSFARFEDSDELKGAALRAIGTATLKLVQDPSTGELRPA